VDVGQRLSEARKRRNLTLADIARSTKIRVHYLEAIERDDVDYLPSGFFSRAFVRVYANEVGVNPDDLLDSIDAPVSAEPEPEAPPLPPAHERVSTRPLFIVLSVAAACGLYYIAFAPARTVSEAPRVAAEIPIATAADRIEPAVAAVPRAASDVELQIHSSGGCIVAVTADGRLIPSQPSGETVVLKARGEVVLRVGDFGACAPAVKPDSPARSPRRARIESVAPSPVAITHAVDQQSEAAPPVVEPAPSVPDAQLPQPDESTPPTAIERF
jgi:transcriptional regulator with XRE-family HTH domain